MTKQVDVNASKYEIEKADMATPLVAVYCGSRQGNNPVYTDAAIQLGTALAKAGLGLVYGAASIGLMGLVADAVLANNAPVVGVIPEFMLTHEIAHKNLTKLHITDSMHTRKAMMADYADAFVTLPGGLGTLEEIMEIATWRQLYQHEKPMIILNIAGFYDNLIEHLRYTTDQGFMKPEDLQRLVICHSIDEAVAKLTHIVKQPNYFDSDKI